MLLLRSNASASAVGLDLLPGKVNYYNGNDANKWYTEIPTYSKVKFQGVYPGVDLVYYGDSGNLEYNFVLAPGADPSRIRLAVTEGDPSVRMVGSNAKQEGRRPKATGSGRLRVDRNGDLVTTLGGGEVRFRKPTVYQVVGNNPQHGADDGQPIASIRSSINNRQFVKGRYVLEGGDEVGFEIADYDRRRTLIIDPILTYATYTSLGNTNGAGGAGIGVDSSGNAYIIGSVGAGGSEKIFVVGLNPQGNAILYTTYLSGSSGSGPGGIAVDSQGDAYITGTAGPGFPTTVGAYMASCSNGCGIFAAKLLPAGELGYSAILGGSNASGRAIAIDGSGAAYITGTISSADLPVVNAFQPSYAGMLCTGCSNAFVQKLDPTGSQLSYSTYLGGGFGNYGYATTEASGVAVDAAGNAYVVGATESPLFPVKNALEASLNSGFGNAFLTKFTPDGTALIYSTYLGGSGTSVNTFADSAAGVAVDSAGNVYVTGNTVSRDFPLTMNAYKASCVESALETCQSSQIYVLDIDPSGASLVYSTLLGTGAAGGVAVDSSSGAWVTGVTASNYYPVVGAVQSSLQQVPFSNTDTFVTHLSSAGIPTFSTYLGGSYTGDIAAGVALDSAGNAYVAGTTGVGLNNLPFDFPIVNPAPGTQQFAQFYSPPAIFAAKISPAASGPSISLSPLYTSILSLRNVSSDPLTISGITSSSNLTLAGGNCAASLLPGAGCILILYPQSDPTISGTLTIASNAPGSPQSFTIYKSRIGSNQFFVSPNYMEFPAQLVDTASGTQTVTLTNLFFPNPIGISQIATSLADPTEGISGNFSQTNNCPASLPAGESCTVNVQYQPTGGPDGVEFGQLQIVTDTAPTNYTIYLSGVRSSESLIASNQNTQFGKFISSVQFGTQYVDATPLPRVVVLTNVDAQPVTVSGFSVTGPFSQRNNCSAPLPPNASCRVAISFVPNGNSYATGTLTANFSAQGGPITVNLSGTGEILSDLGISPLALSFGSVILGSSNSQTLILTNKSTNTLTLSQFNLSLADYTQANDCGGALAPSATCTVTLTFTPNALGTRNGTLSIQHNGMGSPQVISLSGSGRTPLVITPDEVSFGEQNVGVASAPQPVGVSNQSNSTVMINSASISGDFELLQNSCPASLTSFYGCSLQLDFKPTTTGSMSGTLTITASDYPSPHIVPLTGTGVVLPVVSLSPSSLNFDKQLVSSASSAQTVTVSNTGPVPLHVSSVVVFGEFSQTNTCTAVVVAPNGTCTISVSFSPTVSGGQVGRLTIQDDAPDSPQTVALSGVGADFSITLSSSSAIVAAGQAATYELIVSPAGGLSQSVKLSCSGAPQLSTCSVSPPSVSFNGVINSTATVTVTTTAMSSSQCELWVMPPSVFPSGQELGWWCLVALSFLLVSRSAKMRRFRSFLGVSLIAGALLAACGGGGGRTIIHTPGTPPGTYSLTVTGAASPATGSAQVTHSLNLTLTVR